MKSTSPDGATGQEISDLLWINPSTRTIRHEVVERLREAITLGQLAPGQRLLERELCEWTGVSRTSIREALRQLESEGLVETIPRRGPAVSVISADKLRDIYDVRMSVEPRMVELFIDRASDKECDELTKAAHSLKAAVSSGDPVKVSSAKGKFFDVLTAGCGNPTLGDVVRSLHLRLTLVKSAYLQQPRRWAKSADELMVLAEAIKAKDTTRASKACKKHLDAAARAALDTLDKAQRSHGQKKAG